MQKLNIQFFAETETIPANPTPPELNYETEIYMNTTPSGTTPTWADLSALTQNMSNSLNEVISQVFTYGDKGWGKSNVTGAQFTTTLTGDCSPGNVAYEYLTSDAVMLAFGAARQTHLKLVKGTKTIIWPVTLANITKGQGAANGTNALTLTIHGNGKPTVSDSSTSSNSGE